MSESDLELLARYARHNAEDAFEEIVRRHLGLVYSAALRQVRSPQLAEDVAQSAFLKLARHARELAPDTVVTAWLYQVTRREGIDAVRREARRQLREQIASEMNVMNATADDWTQIEPLLDEAMHALGETDRTAVLLRYFENKSLREVGETLGTSDDTAQKRVSRAIERLREFFAGRGVTIGASGLVLAVSANAVQAVPAGLSLAINAAVIGGTAVHTATAIAATKTIVMTSLQKTLVGAAVAVAIGTGIYETRRGAAARSEVQELRLRQAPLAEQIEQLTRERAEAAARQIVLQKENEALRQSAADLPRLRGEIARLRAMEKQMAQSKNGAVDVTDPSIRQFLHFKEQAAEISRHLDQMPDKKIPELKLLLEEDWLAVVRTAKFDTDENIRRALSHLRSRAKNRVPMGRALNEFIRANHGQLPAELLQMKPYLKSALDDISVATDDETLHSILERYTLLRTGTASELPASAWIVVENAPVDKDYDSRAKFGNGTSTIIGTGLHSAGDPDDKSY
jgi:RNA polymerase sigma factor (sigma-70 family)